LFGVKALLDWVELILAELCVVYGVLCSQGNSGKPRLRVLNPWLLLNVFLRGGEIVEPGNWLVETKSWVGNPDLVNPGGSPEVLAPLKSPWMIFGARARVSFVVSIPGKVSKVFYAQSSGQAYRGFVWF